MSILTTNLVTNSTYGVSLHPSVIYGKEIADLTFKVRTTADMVNLYGIIPEEEHRRVYSSLPDGVIDDAHSYDWLVFKTLNDEIIVLGEPWIKAVTGGDAMVQYLVKVVGNQETPTHIRAALSSIGIYEYSIETVTSQE